MKADEIINEAVKKDNIVSEQSCYNYLREVENKLIAINNRGAVDAHKKPYVDIGDRGYTMLLPEEFRRLYICYIIMQSAEAAEDWDCYNMYNEIYTQEFSEAERYLVRNKERPDLQIKL